MPRSLGDLIAQADAFADKFEQYEPRDADRGEPTLMALRRVAYQRSLIERDLAEAVRRARIDGVSWAKIGKELGTSGEAARQRYANKIDA